MNSELLRDGDQRWINVDRFTLRTKYKNVFAIGDVTEIRLDNGITIPKAGIFAEGEAKVVSQQIIDEIKNNNNSNNSKRHMLRNSMEKAFALWKWEIKEQDILMLTSTMKEVRLLGLIHPQMSYIKRNLISKEAD
jgi:NADH dehydrogenase FAD-containing subunit